MSATYDLGTPIGCVRLLTADTDVAQPLFEDEEIEAFLALSGGDVRLAAAAALEAVMADRARLARRVRVGGYETEQHALGELRSLAERLRADSSAGSASAIELSTLPDHLDGWR